MKKQIGFSLIVVLLCLCSGCCSGGYCPYCSSRLTYVGVGWDVKPGRILTCYGCQGKFRVTESCGTCAIDGQYNAEHVAISKQNQARRASISTAATMMTLGQYYRGDYDVRPYKQPGYVAPAPQYNPWKQNDNYWQEERAFQEYQQNLRRP